MDWWNDLTDWISSDNGWRVMSGAIIPFVAIVVAGIVAALIGRGATKRVVAMQEREARNAAVAGIVSAARKAATWGSLGHDERSYADHLAEDADIRLRLLPVSGAPLAANWTQHEIADIKKNSSTFSFQAEQSLSDFRDRLLEWQARPNRARKLFKSDLERWKFDSPDPDADLIKRQQEWNADQTDARGAATGGTVSAATLASVGTPRTNAPTASGAAADAERPTPTTTSLRPAPKQQSAAPAASGFSVTRGGAAPKDPDATTPISDESASDATTPISNDAASDATTPISDGATRAYGDTAGAPMRPTLGSPAAQSRDAAAQARDAATQTRDAAAQARDAAPARTAADTDDDTTDERNDLGAPVPPRVASPTAADAHVNRAPAADRNGDDPRTPQTRSVPTRIADGPAEPSDANETSEAPYTQPISASELRRRAADDDE